MNAGYVTNLSVSRPLRWFLRARTPDMSSWNKLRVLRVFLCFLLLAIAVGSRFRFEQALGCLGKLRRMNRLELASPMPVSWNQIAVWLTQLHGLRSGA